MSVLPNNSLYHLQGDNPTNTPISNIADATMTMSIELLKTLNAAIDTLLQSQERHGQLIMMLYEKQPEIIDLLRTVSEHQRVYDTTPLGASVDTPKAASTRAPSSSSIKGKR